MHYSKGLVAALVAAAAVVSLATLLWPLPKDLQGVTPLQFRTDVGLSFFFALLYVIGGFLFTLGLGSFTNKLRSVYFTICAGTVVMGLTFLQLPIISLLDAWGNFWASSGSIGIPFVVAGAIVFWGARLYAKLIDTKTIWSNWLIALLTAGGGALFSVFLPHAKSLLSERVFDFGIGLRVAPVLLIFMASMTVLRIRKNSGTTYGVALAWLFTAMLATDIALLGAVVEILTGHDFIPAWYIALDCVYTITAILWVVAALAFTKIGLSLNETIARNPGSTSSSSASAQT